jgi:hypothetical protein
MGVVTFKSRSLYPGEEPRYPSYRVAVWVPEPVWTLWRTENCWIYRDSNSDFLVIQPIASFYNGGMHPVAHVSIKFKTPSFATNFSACFISCTCSLHVSALISGLLQVISYNVVYSKDSYYIYYFNGSVEELLHWKATAVVKVSLKLYYKVIKIVEKLV